jgi:hypothetical protein
MVGHDPAGLFHTFRRDPITRPTIPTAHGHQEPLYGLPVRLRPI